MDKQNFYTRLDKKDRSVLNAVFYVFFVNGIFAMIMGSLLPQTQGQVVFGMRKVELSE